MIRKTVETEINNQIGREFYSAALYLSMSAHFERSNLPGFAHWMRLQFEEEQNHATRLFDFVLTNGGSVEIHAMAKPPSTFGSPLEVMEASLEHEQHVTSEINSLYELAISGKDYSAQIEMQWFIGEQVEEEKTVSVIVAQLKMVGDNDTGLLLLDSQLASRKVGSTEVVSDGSPGAVYPC